MSVKTKTTKKTVNLLDPILEEPNLSIQEIEKPKKKFNAKDYYQANKEKLKKKYQEKKQLDCAQEKVFCDICECYYLNSHKSKHFITDKHMLRDLIKLLKQSVNDEPEIEKVNYVQPNEKEIEILFDQIYCYKI
jgi:hypothetical protein